MPRGRDGGLRLLVAADRRVADDPDDLCEPTCWVVTDTNTVADRISGREQRAAEGLVQDYDIRHHIVHRRCEAIDASAGSLLFDVAPADPTAFAVAAGVIVVAASVPPLRCGTTDRIREGTLRVDRVNPLQ